MPLSPISHQEAEQQALDQRRRYHQQLIAWMTGQAARHPAGLSGLRQLLPHSDRRCIEMHPRMYVEPKPAFWEGSPELQKMLGIWRRRGPHQPAGAR